MITTDYGTDCGDPRRITADDVLWLIVSLGAALWALLLWLL